jgi:hypothetical protein
VGGGRGRGRRREREGREGGRASQPKFGPTAALRRAWEIRRRELQNYDIHTCTTCQINRCLLLRLLFLLAIIILPLLHRLSSPGASTVS